MADPTSPKSLLWGIDGGGTKTTLLLAEHRGEQPAKILATIRAGSSNVNSRPWEDITAELSAAMHSAFQSASQPPQRAAALVAAFAGVGSVAVCDMWQGWFVSQEVAEVVRIVDDGEPLIAAGLSSGWGIVLISGTGSAVFGRSASGKTARAGGWGYLFGDEGSGFAIGRAALRAMTQTLDRGQEPTPLMRKIADKWSLSAPREIVDRAFSAAEPRRKIAEVAILVCELASQGDRESQAQLRFAAGELAGLVQTVAEQLGHSRAEFPLALSGGVAANSAYLRNAIAESIAKRGLAATPISVVEVPAQGCIEIARRIVNK